MERLSVRETAEALGAKADFEGYFDEVCTDTRDLKENCLFVAIKGEKFDGHDFVKKAVESGASAVLVQSQTDCGREIRVDSTRDALLRLAGYYRKRFDIPVVGITGSVGKTTTKEMTWSVLSQKYRTLKNEGNLNNEIGLPKTIFRLDSGFEAAVLEMGMNNLGEISRLSKAASPTVGIIGNIGVSHLENLKTRENILKAKLEILDGMSEDAPLLLNGDDEYLKSVKDIENPIYHFGIENKDCTFNAHNIIWREDGCEFIFEYPGGEQDIFLPVLGRHNIYNALAAAGAGYLLGVSPHDAAQALKSYTPEGMRQRIRKVGGVTFIEDCYNASPDSVKAALSTLKGMKAERRIAVLGDMLELGELSVRAHRDAGRQCAEYGVDMLFTYGERMEQAVRPAVENGIPKAAAFSDKAALAQSLLGELKDGDAVLFKASRGMKLEDVLERLYNECDE